MGDMEPKAQVIYFGGGCFWCTEAVFASLRGVSTVIPGYMGGTIPNPTYEIVSSGKSGYIEVVAVTYDETVIALADLLDIFFAAHDPTTPGRQGNDVGEQYQSVIFYTNEAQVPAIQAALQRAKEAHSGKEIVTTVVRATDFYRAEDNHQRYYEQHKQQPYCQVVIYPKLEKLQKNFPHTLK